MLVLLIIPSLYCFVMLLVLYVILNFQHYAITLGLWGFVVHLFVGFLVFLS